MAIMESVHDFNDEAADCAIGGEKSSNKMLTLVVQPKSMMN